MKYLIQENLQKNCSAHDLDKWFSPLDMRYDEKDTKLTVFFPHVFFEPWFEKQGKNIFEQTVKAVSIQSLGFIPLIEYAVSNKAQKKPQNFHKSFLKSSKKNDATKTFTNFLYNKKNEFTLASAQEVAKNIHSPIYNPFIIYGKSSVGKTHILNAIYNNLLDFNKNIFMGTIGEFYKNIASWGVDDFINKFSVFIVDDFQYMDTTDQFLQSTIQFIDKCILEKKQLIFATSLSLASKKNYKEVLRSRLAMGLTVKLSKPDMDIRMRFALAYCQELNIKISKNQLLMISQRCLNISILHGIILKIKAFYDITDSNIKDSNIENILLTLGSEKKSISSQDIINITSNYFNVDKKKILANARQPHVVQTRQIAMFLCRDLLGLSYPSIGKLFGGKDHSTVMYSIKKINELLNMNKDVHNSVTKIKQKCLSI